MTIVKSPSEFMSDSKPHPELFPLPEDLRVSFYRVEHFGRVRAVLDDVIELEAAQPLLEIDPWPAFAVGGVAVVVVVVVVLRGGCTFLPVVDYVLVVKAVAVTALFLPLPPTPPLPTAIRLQQEQAMYTSRTSRQSE